MKLQRDRKSEAPVTPESSASGLQLTQIEKEQVSDLLEMSLPDLLHHAGAMYCMLASKDGSSADRVAAEALCRRADNMRQNQA